MQFLRQYRFVLLFLALLVFCSVMIIQTIDADTRGKKHTELREAFILLHTRGYTNEAARLYQKLLRGEPNLPNEQLLEDFQRTMMLVDPASDQTNNLIWRYHWFVSNKLDERSESTLVRARKLAEEP